MIWSKSSLSSYVHCPQRFYREVILHEKGQPEHGVAMEQGSRFHTTCEIMYEKIDFGLMHRLGEQRGEIEKYLRDLMGIDPEPYVNDLYDNFAIYEADRWIKCKKAKALNADLYFKPVLSEVEVVNEEKSIRGMIDWIFRSFDDEYIIGEIKTGKEYEVSEIRKELCFLTLLVQNMNILDKEPKYIMCYYPRTNWILFEKPKRQSFDAIWRMYNKGQTGLANQDFHKNIGILCGWCPYSDACLTEEEEKWLTKEP